MSGERRTAPHAPVIVTIDFHFTDGEQVAKASYSFPPGCVPTEAEIADAARNAREQVRGGLGEIFDWQSRHSFVSNAMAERTFGMRFAVPGPDVWEREWAQ